MKSHLALILSYCHRVICILRKQMRLSRNKVFMEEKTLSAVEKSFIFRHNLSQKLPQYFIEIREWIPKNEFNLIFWNLRRGKRRKRETWKSRLHLVLYGNQVHLLRNIVLLWQLYECEFFFIMNLRNGGYWIENIR